MNLPATVDHLRDHLRAHNDTAVPSIYLGMELRFDSAFDGDLGKGAPCGTHYAGRPVPAVRSLSLACDGSLPLQTYASGSAYALGRKEVEWLASEAGMKHWQDNFSGWKCKHEDVNMGLLLSLNPEPTYLQHEWRLWWRYPAWDDERECQCAGDCLCDGLMLIDQGRTCFAGTGLKRWRPGSRSRGTLSPKLRLLHNHEASSSVGHHDLPSSARN
jgi:hypothetical protein